MRAVALLCAPLDPLHYMILLGPKYDPNMTGESVVLWISSVCGSLRVLFECARRVEVWNIDDPYNTTAEYEEQVYQQIKTKIKQLAKRLR